MIDSHDDLLELSEKVVSSRDEIKRAQQFLKQLKKKSDADYSTLIKSLSAYEKKKALQNLGPIELGPCKKVLLEYHGLDGFHGLYITNKITQSPEYPDTFLLANLYIDKKGKQINYNPALSPQPTTIIGTLPDDYAISPIWKIFFEHITHDSYFILLENWIYDKITKTYIAI